MSNRLIQRLVIASSYVLFVATATPAGAQSVPPSQRIGSTPFVPPTRTYQSPPPSGTTVIGGCYSYGYFGGCYPRYRYPCGIYGDGLYVGVGYYPGSNRRYSRRYYYPTDSPQDGSYYSARYGSFYLHDSETPSLETEPLVRVDSAPVGSVTTGNTTALGQRRLINDLMRDTARSRLSAARELARYPNVATSAALIDALVNDATAFVRAAAAKSLGELGDAGAYIPLRRAARFDDDEQVRRAAALAAMDIEYACEPEELPQGFAYRPLNEGREQLSDHLEILRRGRPDQRDNAVAQLGRFKGTQSAAALIDALINDPDEYVRKEAARQLEELRDEMSLPFLLAAAQTDPTRLVRRGAEDAWKRLTTK